MRVLIRRLPLAGEAARPLALKGFQGVATRAPCSYEAEGEDASSYMDPSLKCWTGWTTALPCHEKPLA